MDTIVDHIAAAVAVLVAIVSALFARKANKPTRRQELADVVRDACDYAKAHPAAGMKEERVALDAARRLDMLDGRRDFADEGLLMVAIRAELARRAK